MANEGDDKPSFRERARAIADKLTGKAPAEQRPEQPPQAPQQQAQHVASPDRMQAAVAEASKPSSDLAKAGVAPAKDAAEGQGVSYADKRAFVEARTELGRAGGTHQGEQPAGETVKAPLRMAETAKPNAAQPHATIEERRPAAPASADGDRAKSADRSAPDK